MKVYVVYDSESGHTEVLAKAIGQGAQEIEGAEVFVKHVNEADVRDLHDIDALIWGCPGHFGTISAGLKSWIDKLGYLWAAGKLVGKVGAAFCTTATLHGGAEMTLWNLITPMMHNGMIIVGLPSNVPENVLHGSYYGVAVTCPVEDSEDAPKNMPTESDQALGRALGRRVAEVAKKLHG
ncbi:MULTISPECIES: NAD(P)H-dependent oxidoreductase [Thermoactinomyces]|jgi:NAD(P)H dehydrogenase (quinone)|uniref:NAD(P)H-dependent oxidoreductase n=1 Tax=Thermoactinomyces daqus TaxID=1329516 RepID=A0A7W1X7P8_9BACL|nr:MULTISPECIES: NAD(P)H-dependent oxidoreductase [Thermoactinomyces]MBA4541509.1 NAD(P)H-dependent oxidoreductase [Thermoactinomyces daqus]MBH8596985.1 NAD(P)H-dependent oxidoreductase [Thermoactinomyces sp. CICC 10523]MBH8603761.1 NAD(P)H-dependent oxidoreductase [Thermoactinomyces sp. CICC 10522]MBH8607604.1 NAD(P)H-dependent oxidoreductase [Thermoactinomyces sp. CICC 10521]